MSMYYSEEIETFAGGEHLHLQPGKNFNTKEAIAIFEREVDVVTREYIERLGIPIIIKDDNVPEHAYGVRSDALHLIVRKKRQKVIFLTKGAILNMDIGTTLRHMVH